MPCVCAVRGCKNRYATAGGDDEVRFFHFPKDEAARRLWLRASGREEVKSYERVCSAHFADADWLLYHRLLNAPKSKWKLSPTAVPTLRLPPPPADEAQPGRRSVTTQTEFGDESPAHRNELLKLKRENQELRTLEKSIHTIFTAGQVERLKHPNKKFSWTLDDITSATMLHSAGPAAYDYLCKQNFPLPQLATLRQWATKIVTPPEISPELLSRIKDRPNKNESERLCIIAFNEKKLVCDESCKKNKDLELTKTKYAYTVVLRSLFGEWMQPIYSNCIHRITPMHVRVIITKVHEADCTVVAVVSDLAFSTRWLWKELKITPKNPWFLNPYDNKSKIFVFSDVSNLIKLLRNHFLDTGFTYKGIAINCEPILKIMKSDARNTLLINESHIYIKNSARQDIGLALQLFSHKTAATIRNTADDDSTSLNCAEFIETVTDWFQIFNSSETQSKNAYGKSLERQDQILNKMKNYMNNLYACDKKSLFPFQKGILISIASLQQLLKNITTGYILTNRLNRVFEIERRKVFKRKNEEDPLSMSKKICICDTDAEVILEDENFSHSSKRISKQNAEDAIFISQNESVQHVYEIDPLNVNNIDQTTVDVEDSSSVFKFKLELMDMTEDNSEKLNNINIQLSDGNFSQPKTHSKEELISMCNMVLKEVMSEELLGSLNNSEVFSSKSGESMTDHCYSIRPKTTHQSTKEGILISKVEIINSARNEITSEEEIYCHTNLNEDVSQENLSFHMQVCDDRIN